MNARYVLVAALFAIPLSCAGFGEAQAVGHTPGHVRIAPADEYFGHQKMSILEISNRLRDLTARAVHEPRSAVDALHDAASTEDAIRDWERKYSHDPWLAKDVAALEHLYAQVPTPAGRSRMHVVFEWLRRRYPQRKSLVNEAAREVAKADAATR